MLMMLAHKTGWSCVVVTGGAADAHDAARSRVLAEGGHAKWFCAVLLPC